MSKARAYDERLLAQAPTVEKAQAREGYDVDILGSQDVEARSGSHGQHPVAVDAQSHRLASQRPLSAVKARPWWKTTKGRVIIGIALLLIVAAAVGGGVGGALGNKKKNPAAASASSATPSPTPTAGGGGTDGSGGGGSDTQGTSPVSSGGTEGQGAVQPTTSVLHSG